MKNLFDPKRYVKQHSIRNAKLDGYSISIIEKKPRRSPRQKGPVTYEHKLTIRGHDYFFRAGNNFKWALEGDRITFSWTFDRKRVRRKIVKYSFSTVNANGDAVIRGCSRERNELRLTGVDPHTEWIVLGDCCLDPESNRPDCEDDCIVKTFNLDYGERG